MIIWFFLLLIAADLCIAAAYVMYVMYVMHAMFKDDASIYLLTKEKNT